MTETWFAFAAGVLLLAAGGEWLARLVGRAAPAPLARAVAAVVAVLAVGLVAAGRGSPGVALGCVVGGAVATVGLGLGLAAARRPLRGTQPLVGKQLPAMIAATFLVWFLSGDGAFDRLDGVWLVVAFAAWATWSAPALKAAAPKPAAGADRKRVAVAVLLLALGALVLAGAAVDLHGLYRWTQWTTGLTLVAVGAALPVLVAVVRAGWAGDGDAALATAALVNTTTLLLGLGVVCVAQPFRVTDPAAFRELPALGLSAVLLVPALLNGLRVSRGEGVMWVGAYAALVAWQYGAFGR